MEKINTTHLEVQNLTIKGIKIDYSLVTGLEICESLVTPGITGTITFKDYQGLKELGGVLPFDDISFTYSVEGRMSITVNFKIYTDGASKVDDQTYQLTSYGFCSPWMIEGYTRQVNKGYKDKAVHEIVRDLLSQICQPSEIGFIQESATKLNNFVSPLWTVPHTIKYLSSFAKDMNNTAGYILWEDISTKKLNWTTVDYLYKNWGTDREYDLELIYRPGNLLYEGKLFKIDIEPTYDVIRSLYQGSYKTKLVGFNYDKKEVFTTKKNAKEYQRSHLSFYSSITPKYTDDKYASTRVSYMFPSTDSPMVDVKEYEDMVEGEQFYRYTMLHSDSTTINTWTEGSANRRIGALAKLRYPSVDQTEVAGNRKDNSQLTGRYLIRNIKHYFQNSQYFQLLTLIADGYKAGIPKHGDEFVTW